MSFAEGQRGPSNWASNTKELRLSLSEAVDGETLRELHRLSPARHFLVLGLLVTAGVLFGAGAFRFENSFFWVPCSLLLGLVFFDFTVLFHEVVHGTVLGGKKERLGALLGWLYAIPSGLSRSQFSRWHLDHHAGLGSQEDDPKRHWLSPGRNARWLKLLYFTPLLIPIYFRAAARENAGYEPALRRKIALERIAVTAVHLSAASYLYFFLGGKALAAIYLVPYFFGFPLAFALNRLGQHYDIDPEDPARWGTRIERSMFWDCIFLCSTYHLEHHYYPGVPLYNLRKLNLLLSPFFDGRGVPARSYPWLLWNWLVLNRKPHTRWA